jgi:glycosyltransferase involved in cell wall biosynthesis
MARCISDSSPLASGGPVPIAVVMSNFGAGGTERQMIELVRRLDRRRWDVHVACLRDEGVWLDRIMSAAPCAAFPIRSFKRPRVLFQLRSFARWCRRHRFPIVHTVDAAANIFGLPGAALAGVPVRVGTRRDLDPGRPATTLLTQRAAYACAHVIVANAQAVADRLRRERVPEGKVAVVPNGLDVGLFAIQRVARPVRRVVMVANLRPEKGHDVLIDAASDVLARFHDARFDVIGGGNEHARLVALARTRGVAHAVSFLGHSDTIPEHLAAADAFVLPSRTEAMSNAVLEAMAAALPVVVSAVGGIPEVIEHGVTGLLVPPGDARALANALGTLMDDESMAARLGTAARAHVDGRYSFDRMVASFEHIYLTELRRAAFRGVTPNLFPFA